MSNQMEETMLTSLADSAADSFFDGGASSKNVITAEPEKKNLDEVKEVFEKFTADDLIGDLIGDIKVNPTKEVTKEGTTDPAEKQSTTKDESDFGFLVEKGLLAGFEDDSPVKTKDDLENLIKGNKEQWVTEAKEEALKEYSDSLPEEIKFLVDYAKGGGDDLKSVFKILSQTQEFKEYDLENADDQRAIVRNYYGTQGWTEDEIEEELLNLQENDRLKKHSQTLKPKLDKINQTQLEEKQQRQQYIQQQEAKAKQFFESNVVTTLKKGDIGGLKLTKQEQADVYNALIKEKYQSFDGETNRLGALLDKIQYVEPNYELLAKVTMYLSDPVGFEKKLRDTMNTEVTAEQVKKIKIDQQKQKIGSSHNPEKDGKKLPKLNQGFINPFE